MRLEKRLFAMLALLSGLVAGIWILASSAGFGSVNFLGVVIGLAVLYGSYLIFRGKTGLFFRGTRARTGSFINLGIGILALVVPGGVGGSPAILAIVSGVLGLLSA